MDALIWEGVVQVPFPNYSVQLGLIRRSDSAAAALGVNEAIKDILDA